MAGAVVYAGGVAEGVEEVGDQLDGGGSEIGFEDGEEEGFGRGGELLVPEAEGGVAVAAGVGEGRGFVGE